MMYRTISTVRYIAKYGRKGKGVRSIVDNFHNSEVCVHHYDLVFSNAKAEKR